MIRVTACMEAVVKRVSMMSLKSVLTYVDMNEKTFFTRYSKMNI